MANGSRHRQSYRNSERDGGEGGAAEPAKKRRRVGRGEALNIVGNNPSFLKWEGLSPKKQMKHGTRWYTKGVPQME
jgi:hypothetical protein